MQLHKDLIEARIVAWCAALPASGLYAPMAYLLKLPAKRVRPVALLMGCELFGGKAEVAMDEALGIELFHNFTLMHDDIMDASPLRRGDPTVHVKWNANAAILSGDALLVKAYELMGRNTSVFALFNKYALEVCEGQQLDMDFEQRADVTASEYMEMIRLKTAVLLSCALQVGATLGGASSEERDHLGHFGEKLGLAFQLRDDLLDAFGDPKKTGKQQGGRLRAGKKTWLLIRGMELERAAGGAVLKIELAKPPEARDVTRMSTTLQALGARDEAGQLVQRMEAEAMKELDAVGVPEERKTPLRSLAARLMQRTA